MTLVQGAEASRANAEVRPRRAGDGSPELPVDVRRRVSALARTPRLLIACDYDGALTPALTSALTPGGASGGAPALASDGALTSALTPGGGSARPDPVAVRALRELADLPGTTCA
ncbi:hypothetical protein ACIBFB_21265, partial [Nocardiopsis sp. NPDC050513]